jgi:hypothetical protein
MKQIYAPYTEWEDYKNGMYTLTTPIDSDIIKGAELLANENLFFKTAFNVITNWVVATNVNLSNNSCNKQAWIGQATCCYLYGNNELTTRKSWAMLTDEQRYRANLIADKIVNIYENKNKQVYSGVGNQVLLQWNT